MAKTLTLKGWAILANVLDTTAIKLNHDVKVPNHLINPIFNKCHNS